MSTPALLVSASTQGYLARFYLGTAADGSGQKSFAETSGFDFSKTRDMLDATSADALGGKVKKPGLVDWTGTVKGFFLARDITQKEFRDALDNSTPVYVTIYPEGLGVGKVQYKGACYIKDMKLTADVKNLTTAEFAIEGSGLLVESIQAAAAPTSITSIVVTPAAGTIAHGATQQMIATAHYADSSTADVSSQVDWAVSDPTKATIDSSGLVTGVAAGGPITIVAASGHVSGSTTLTLT